MDEFNFIQEVGLREKYLSDGTSVTVSWGFTKRFNYCSHCGRKTKEEENYCPECGKYLVEPYVPPYIPYYPDITPWNPYCYRIDVTGDVK